MSNNSKLYKIRLSGYLFQNECCLLGKEVLDNVFIRDLLGMNVIPFTDKGKHYKRQHQWQFNGDVVAIRVGKGNGYGIVGAMIYINYSRRLNEPYVAIEDNSSVFESIDVVKDMVERAFKWIYKDTGATIYLEPWDEKIYWFKDCCEAHINATLTENIAADEDWDVNIYLRNVVKDHKKKKGVSPPKKENTTKPKKTIRAAVIDQTKADKVLLKIDNCIMGKTEPKDEMMPITAACAANVMRLPTWTELKNSYPWFRLSETSFYRLRQPDCLTYLEDDSFDELVDYFKNV